MRRKEAVRLCDDRLMAWGTSGMKVSDAWNLLDRMGSCYSNMVSKISSRLGKGVTKLEFCLQKVGVMKQVVWDDAVQKLKGLLVRFGRYGGVWEYQPRMHVQVPRAAALARDGSLRFWTWNVNGLFLKLQLVREHLDNFRPDIFCVQESRSRVIDMATRLPGYHTFEQHMIRGVPGARGLTTFVSMDFKAFVVLQGPHWMVTKVFGSSLDAVIYTVNVYLPGKQTKTRAVVMSQFSAMLKVIHEQAKGAPIIIMGDFNAKGKLVDNYLRRKGLNMFMRNEVRGDTVTYRSGLRESDIDHVLTSVGFTSGVCCPSVVLRDVVGSDHFPVSTTVSNIVRDPGHSAEVSECKYKRIDVGRLERGRTLVVACHNLWDALITEDADVDTLDTLFTSTCHNVAEEAGLHVEVKKVKGRCTYRGGSFLRACSKRSIVEVKIVEDKLLKAHRNPSYPEEIGLLQDELRLAKVRCRSKLARDHRIETMKTIMKACRVTRCANSKAYWKWVRDFNNPSQNRSVGVEPIHDPKSNKLVFNAEEVKEAWTVHYRDLASDIPMPNGHWDEIASKSSLPELCELPKINDEICWGEICATGFAMKRGKSPGDFDLIPLEFLVKGLDPMDPETKAYPSEPSTAMGRKLFQLMKKVWDSEVMPAAWNCSTVVNLPKKGDLSFMDNYRGISLQAIAMKLFSSLVNRRLYGALEAGNRFTSAQAGFRSAEECQAQAIALYETLIRRKNIDLPSYACFIDMKKAFDMVPHGAMLEKCSRIGIRGKCLNILKAMYANSNMRVRGGFGYTEIISLLRGVKQGSPLSPTLFDVFINDLLNGMQEWGVTVPTGDACGIMTLPGLLFADDLVLLADNMKNLQTLMNMATSWANKWGMRFGISKCAIVCFGGDRVLVDEEEWVLQEQSVPVESSYTYLGIMFEENLDLVRMSETQLHSAKRALGALRPLLFAKQVPMHTKIMVIKACILPVLLFGSELWGMNGKLFGKHQTLLNSALRWVVGSQGGSASMSVLAAALEFNIPPLEALAAGERTRALKKYESSKTAIHDLIVSPTSTRKATWVTGGVRWLNKFIEGSPDELVEDNESAEVGPLSPNKTGVYQDKYARGAKGWARFTKQQIFVRKLNNDTSDHTNWYRSHFAFKGSSDWYWLTRCAPQWAEGYGLVTSMRVGAYASAVKWANMRILNPHWKLNCPYCLRKTPETFSHTLMVCARWKVEREKYLGSLIGLIMTEFSLDASNYRLDVFAALMLGGSFDGRRVPNWEPTRIETTKKRLLEVDLEPVDCLGEGYKVAEVDESMEDAFDFSNCYALKVAKFLQSVEKRRMKRLGSLRDSQEKAIYGQRRDLSRPQRVLLETVEELL